MTDQTAGDQPWNAPGAFNPEPKPAKPPRQKRKPRGTKPEAAPSTPPAPRKTRAAKKEKAERAAPETIKVTLKEFAAMRVGEEHARLFVKLHGLLSEVGKAARSKVLAELGKVLA